MGRMIIRLVMCACSVCCSLATSGAFVTLRDREKLWGARALDAADQDPATRRGKYTDIVECVLGISLDNLPREVSLRAPYVPYQGSAKGDWQQSRAWS
jgi:hypothetical protein